MKIVFNKGEVKNPSTNFELHDINASIAENSKVLTTYGGQFQQYYYVLSAIVDIHGDDLSAYYKRKQMKPDDEAAKKPHTARELLIEHLFLPFFVTYLRDSKCESFAIVATEEMVKLLAEMKVPQTSNGNYDLTKLSREQYIKFRYYFVERRMDHPVWVKNSRAKVMELLLNAICMIFCKKVPTDIGVTKID